MNLRLVCSSALSGFMPYSLAALTSEKSRSPNSPSLSELVPCCMVSSNSESSSRTLFHTSSLCSQSKPTCEVFSCILNALISEGSARGTPDSTVALPSFSFCFIFSQLFSTSPAVPAFTSP